MSRVLGKDVPVVTRGRLVLLLVLLLSLTCASGCASRASFDFQADAGTLSASRLSALIPDLERPPYMGEPVTRASELRHDALVDLRRQGEDEALLADLLTEQFSAESRAVPFWGGAAQVDGVEAWLVAEAWGLSGRTLDNIRIWAFDRSTGDVLASAASR